MNTNPRRKTNYTSSTLSDRCYKLLTRIPKGRVTTYKALAAALGTKGYRAIGTICGKNPNAPRVPCHRVVNSDGRLGGYSGSGGIQSKIKLLKAEGITIERNRVQNLKKVIHTFRQ